MYAVIDIGTTGRRSEIGQKDSSIFYLNHNNCLPKGSSSIQNLIRI